MPRFYFILFLLTSLAFTDNLKSTSGKIDFKSDSNNTDMRLNSTGLGIGTTSPAANLHVNGTAIINGTMTAQNVTVNNILQLSVLEAHPSNPSNGSLYVNSNGKIYTYLNGAWSPLYTTEIKYNRGMVKVNTSWETVTLDKTYSNMIVVATPTNIFTGAPITARIRNTTGNSFDIKIQRMDGSGSALGNDRKVYYFVIEEGVYTQAEHGIKMEAGTFSSNVTDNKNTSWTGEKQLYQQTYSNPVVLGQVMTENDTDFSTFWARGTGLSSPPDSATLYMGKHTGADSDTNRADETIGYVILESGTQRHRDLAITAGVGDATIGGTDTPSSSYSISGPGFTRSAIASLATMNGGDGGAVFFREFESDAAITASELLLNVDEDKIEDAERAHAEEQIAYAVFEDVPIKMEKGITTISTDFSTISLGNTFTSPVVLATIVNEQTEPITVRLRNASGSSFDIKVDHMSLSTNTITGVNVHYLVVEEGVYDYNTYGVKMEARKHVVSINSNGSWAGTQANTIQTYASPVVLGNNQTYNNTGFSTFWSSDGDNEEIPSSNNLYIGLTKMASTLSSANTETAGYLVIEDDHAVIDNIKYIASVGNDTIEGYDDGVYTYNIGESIDVAITTQTAMDGLDGGTVIYSENPNGTTTLKMFSDEDILFDAERNHATEQAAYLIFY